MQAHSVVDEEKLVEEVAADPRKFGEIYDAHYATIFGYIFRRTANYDASKDIAAETFLKAYGAIGSFTWRNIPVLHWLYRIATNEINKYFNRRRYLPESLNRIHEEYGIDITDYSSAETERIALEEDLARHREYLRINDRIKALDVKYQTVIALRFYEQKSIRDIAVILGKREGTIKSLLSRGLHTLRSSITGRTS